MTMRGCRDGEVLGALARSLEARGRMPTMKELCGDIGIDRGTLIRNLDRLVGKGALKRLPNGTLRFELARMPAE